MDKQYKSLEKEKKVSELLKKYDNLTSEEVVFLIDFFISLKNKELGITVSYKIDSNYDNSLLFYDSIQNVICISKKRMIDDIVNKERSITANLSKINHEFRHVTQLMDFKNNILAKIVLSDPLSIIFAKEYLTKEMLENGSSESEYTHYYHDLLSEYEASYYGTKKTIDWLSFFAPELKAQYLIDTHDEYQQCKLIIDNVTNKKQPDLDELSKTICKASLLTDAALMQNPKLLKEYPILQTIYHYDGSKKTYFELTNEKDSIIGNEKNESKIDKINKFYSIITLNDPILNIEKKLDEIEKGILVGRDSKSQDAEVKFIISAIKDMDVQFYFYLKEIIDSMIRNYQNKKQLLNKEFNDKLKSLPPDDVSKISIIRKSWLKKSEVISRQQEVLVNIFTLLSNYGNDIKENSKVHTNKEMTLNEADKLLKEQFGVSKSSKYIYLDDNQKKYRVPNVEMKKMLLESVENLIKIKNTNAEQMPFSQLIKAIMIVFDYDNKKDSKDNSIKTGISVLNSIYEKLETERIENIDKLFNSLSITSKYLLSLEDKEELDIDRKIIKPSIFSEFIINGESYVKEIKTPEVLEFERVDLLHQIEDTIMRETIEKKYNKLIKEVSQIYDYEKKKSR